MRSVIKQISLTILESGKMNDTEVIRNVIPLNNMGVSFMQMGNFKLAILHLLEALKSCHSILQAGASVEQSPSWDDHTLDRWMSQTLFSGNFRNNINDEDGYVYKNAMYLSQDAIQGRPNSVLRTLLSFTLIFNTALAHHQQALVNKGRNPSISRTQLRKAVRFYELAFKFHQEARLESNIFFAMVTFNNLGQIHQSLQEEEHANNYFRCLISKLMFAIHRSGSKKSAVSDEMLQGFLGNSCHLLLLGTQPTAGAA